MELVLSEKSVNEGEVKVMVKLVTWKSNVINCDFQIGFFMSSA
jgi:hypothetical protein